MNINDTLQNVPDYKNFINQANEIYARQEKLEDHYWKIENRQSPTVTVNSRYGQFLIKDFLWRFTEEIGEALEAKAALETEHAKEEFADALHFLTGLFVILDKRDLFTNIYISPTPFHHEDKLERLIVCAGRVGNCLKLKPWKQTDVPTDENYFYGCLEDLMYAFLALTAQHFSHKAELFKYYYAKSEVNLFRIRSKY